MKRKEGSSRVRVGVKSGNEIRNVESRRGWSGESHGGSVQKPKVNTQEPG
jgi:hypothetical protein